MIDCQSLVAWANGRWGFRLSVDRVVQTVQAKLVLEPIFEADFDRAAYVVDRPKRSALDCGSNRLIEGN